MWNIGSFANQTLANNFADRYIPTNYHVLFKHGAFTIVCNLDKFLPWTKKS
jgi:hypothetical protein